MESRVVIFVQFNIGRVRGGKWECRTGELQGSYGTPHGNSGRFPASPSSAPWDTIRQSQIHPISPGLPLGPFHTELVMVFLRM